MSVKRRGEEEGVREIEDDEFKTGLVFTDNKKGTQEPTVILGYTPTCPACIYFRKDQWATLVKECKKMGVAARQCDLNAHQGLLRDIIAYNESADIAVPLLMLVHAQPGSSPLFYDGGELTANAIQKWVQKHVLSRSSPSSRVPPSTTTTTSLSAHSRTREEEEEEEEEKKNKEEEEEEEEREEKEPVPIFTTRPALETFLRAHKNDTVVLQWYVSGCMPCRIVSEWLQEWNSEYGSSHLVFAKASANIPDAPGDAYPITQIIHRTKTIETIKGADPGLVDSFLPFIGSSSSSASSSTSSTASLSRKKKKRK